MAEPDSYVNDSEITAFMQLINPSFTSGMINDIIVEGTYEHLNSLMDGVEEQAADTLLVDGTGDRYVYASKIPIVSLSEIAVIGTDNTESAYILGGPSKNIWWDCTTGRIWTWTTEEYYEDKIEYGYIIEPFPNRPKCVRIKGVFGTAPTDLVKHIQLLLILKQYSLLQPGTYPTDIMEERIGKYQYRFYSGTVVEKNQRRGIDGYINWLMESLPRANAIALESI